MKARGHVPNKARFDPINARLTGKILWQRPHWSLYRPKGFNSFPSVQISFFNEFKYTTNLSPQACNLYSHLFIFIDGMLTQLYPIYDHIKLRLFVVLYDLFARSSRILLIVNLLSFNCILYTRLPTRNGTAWWITTHSLSPRWGLFTSSSNILGCISTSVCWK